MPTGKPLSNGLVEDKTAVSVVLVTLGDSLINRLHVQVDGVKL